MHSLRNSIFILKAQKNRIPAQVYNFYTLSHTHILQMQQTQAHTHTF